MYFIHITSLLVLCIIITESNSFLGANKRVGIYSMNGISIYKFLFST